jgi:hypothetical protein
MTKFYSLLLLVLICLIGCDTARNTPDPTEDYFLRYIGTDGHQEGVDMVANQDGTFMLLGTHRLTKEVDARGQIYLVKVNEHGLVLWEKFYGSAEDEIAKDIEPTPDGNYVILAELKTAATGTDILIMTINQDGDQLNTNTFTQPGFSNEIGETITPLEAASTLSGFIVAGHTDYDPTPDSGGDKFEGKTALFIRFNADCTNYPEAYWSYSGGSSGDDFAIKIEQVDDLTSTHPFLLFGYTNSGLANSDLTKKSFNYWITKISQFGSELVIEEGNGILEGSPASTNEYLGSVLTTKNTLGTDGFMLSGIVTDNAGVNKIYLSRLNEFGSPDLIFVPQEINLPLGDVVSLDHKYRKVTTLRSQNSGYLVAANRFDGSNSSIDMVLTKISSNGTLLWTDPITIGGAGDDFESAIYELPDGRIIVFGTMEIGDEEQQKMALIKLNSNGRFNK